MCFHIPVRKKHFTNNISHYLQHATTESHIVDHDTLLSGHLPVL